MGKLTGETFSGETVSFSRTAYIDAMSRYRIKEIEGIVRMVEKGKKVAPEVIRFFRDFLIIQEEDHPDYDRAIAIGSLATRIDLATGQVTLEKLKELGVDHEAACAEYDLVFG